VLRLSLSRGQLTLKLEKASIDEAFIDFTRPVREKLLERYPYLAQVPANAPDGTDSPLPPPPPINWDDLGSVVPVSPSVETDGTSEHPDETDGGTTWHDVALSIAAELMGKIREDIHLKLGYTTSAVSEFRPHQGATNNFTRDEWIQGISRNKFLAKVCGHLGSTDLTQSFP